MLFVTPTHFLLSDAHCMTGRLLLKGVVLSLCAVVFCTIPARCTDHGQTGHHPALTLGCPGSVQPKAFDGGDARAKRRSQSGDRGMDQASRARCIPVGRSSELTVPRLQHT